MPVETSFAMRSCLLRFRAVKVVVMNERRKRIDLANRLSDELSVFADAVMPEQFYPPRRNSASVEPIMRLMGAILVDAVHSFERNREACHRNGRLEFEEALFWLFHDDENRPFSFRFVCDALKVDPVYLRNVIVRWQNGRRSADKHRVIRHRVKIAVN
jgi:hypothetical protein